MARAAADRQLGCHGQHRLLGGKYPVAGPGRRRPMLADGDEITLTQSSVNLEDLIGRYIFSQGAAARGVRPEPPAPAVGGAGRAVPPARGSRSAGIDRSRLSARCRSQGMLGRPPRPAAHRRLPSARRVLRRPRQGDAPATHPARSAARSGDPFGTLAHHRPDLPEDAADRAARERCLPRDPGDRARAGAAHRAFSGWMFASSPAFSALEHPVYDVWVIDCADPIPPSRSHRRPHTRKP